MKTFKTYEEFVNESVLPYELVQYDFSSKNWKEDKERVKSFEEKNPTYDNVRVFVSDEKSRNLEYVFTSWKDTNYRVIQLEENGNVIFVYKYIDDEKRDFNQDYQEILGIKYK